MARSVADTHAHTHVSVPRNDHTHEFHRFGGRNRQNKQRGENLSTLQAIQSLSRGYSQSDYPRAATETQRGEKIKIKNKNLKYVEMILKGCDESWLPKSTLISNGSLFFVQFEARLL